MEKYNIIHGDCLEVLPIENLLFDCCVTDPPYGLKFMGKEWDHGVPGVIFWEKILESMKPGAHLLAFGGTRTFHRLTCAIEDAGFEIRDTLCWLYGTGFPKSHDVSKAIDKAAGAKREQVQPGNQPAYQRSIGNERPWMSDPNHTIDSNTPVTDAAKQWNGWGTALKPAWEPIILARKPLVGTVAANVLEHGVGGLNVEGARVRRNPNDTSGWSKTGSKESENTSMSGKNYTRDPKPDNEGRWPANVLLDEEAAKLLDEQTANLKGGTAIGRNASAGKVYGGGKGLISQEKGGDTLGYGDSGGASRFFYCAKASKKERGEGNNHPTVKPLSLMRWLVRLITPPNGLVLDPFCGSGSTGVAAMRENFRFVGIDLSKDYCDIAEERAKNE